MSRRPPPAEPPPPDFSDPAPVRPSRQQLLDALACHHRVGRPVLLVGPRGVGKTWLVQQHGRKHPGVIVHRCACLGEVLAATEPAAGLPDDGLGPAARVHRLLRALPALGLPLLFDPVARVPPKVAHLVRALLDVMPVWLVADSTLPRALGHVWPLLPFFERLAVPDWTLAGCRDYLAATPDAAERRTLLAAADGLHRLSAGRPAALVALLDEWRRHPHLTTVRGGLRRLALHARITAIDRELAAAR